jgi:hypothetical protein
LRCVAFPHITFGSAVCCVAKKQQKDSRKMSRRSKFTAGPSPYKVHYTNQEAGKTIAGLYK